MRPLGPFKQTLIEYFRDVSTLAGDRPDCVLEMVRWRYVVIAHVGQFDVEFGYETAAAIASLSIEKGKLALATELRTKTLVLMGDVNPYLRCLQHAAQAFFGCLPHEARCTVQTAWRRRVKDELGFVLSDAVVEPERMDMEELYIEEAQKVIREAMAVAAAKVPTEHERQLAAVEMLTMMAPNPCLLEATPKLYQMPHIGCASEEISDDEFRRRAGFYVGAKP